MTSFTGFSAESFEFFHQLEQNNNSQWFQAHRSLWERVKGELSAVCGVLAPFLGDLDPELETSPRTGKCLGRINRDIRFTLDKSPYRDYVDVLFYPSSYGRTKAPGFAVGLTREHCFIGTWLGASMTSWLERFRANLVVCPQIFERYALANDNFADFTPWGGSYKKTRIPGLPPLAHQWAQRKAYYLGDLVPQEQAVTLGAEIIGRIEEDFLRLYPLYLFATSEKIVSDLERFRRRFNFSFNQKVSAEKKEKS